MVREEDQLAQLATDTVAADLALEESLEPRVGQIGDVGAAVESLASPRHRLLVEIGGEYLHGRRVEAALEVRGQEHGNRIGLFARRARRDPDPQLIVSTLGVAQPGDQALFEQPRRPRDRERSA